MKYNMHNTYMKHKVFYTSHTATGRIFQNKINPKISKNPVPKPSEYTI